MSDLIDTTEMYLRTVYELQEEGIVPLRARIAERLAQSGPTVSQTVARMERDGLLRVQEDRHIALTATGEQLAVRVMRKHRIAERLLVDVIGLEWESVHAEACRWEHVISDDVERRLLQLLGNPTQSPFGNPIPGLAELDPSAPRPGPVTGVPLSSVAGDEASQHVVTRIAESLQEQADIMVLLSRAGVRAGSTVWVVRTGPDRVSVSAWRTSGESAELADSQAGHIAVRA